MVLDVKPLVGQIFVRVRESATREEFIGTIGPLKDGSPIIAEVRKLQRAAYDGNRGTWFTASIVVAATDWPNRSSAWVPLLTVTTSLLAGRMKAP